VTCTGEPLSLWCDRCRLARLVSELQRDFAAALMALARVVSPHNRPEQSVDDLGCVGAHITMAKAELADALSLARDIAEKRPA